MFSAWASAEVDGRSLTEKENFDLGVFYCELR